MKPKSDHWNRKAKIHSSCFCEGRWAARPCARHKALNIHSGFLLFVYDFMCVSLLGAYCSSKSCNDRFFFLFYAELGSVIRAPFLADRSILITKSSACSKGSALWRPMRPGRDESDTCWPKRHKAGAGRWGAGSERWRLGGGSDTFFVCVHARAFLK